MTNSTSDNLNTFIEGRATSVSEPAINATQDAAQIAEDIRRIRRLVIEWGFKINRDDIIEFAEKNYKMEFDQILAKNGENRRKLNKQPRGRADGVLTGA